MPDLDLDDVAQWRRRIHATPELGYEEVETARFVAERLRAFGLETHEGWAKTGVVGMLHGLRGPGRVIGLRADMDALPMQEANRFAHASTVRGRMHACGHDGHTAMLLGAARELARAPDFHGTVVFIFQPAEEALGGGQVMIDEGLFDRFGIEEVYGLHNWPQIPAGTIAVREGPVMASCDFFSLTITGHGGHAAMPHMAADPAMAAAHLAVALQTIVSRNAPPHETLVVSITQIHAGTADNVIPGTAELRGTVRCFNPDIRDLAERRIGEIAAGIAVAFGVDIDCAYRRAFPATVNSPAETRHAQAAAASAVGEANVLTHEPPSMTAEDFAFMLEARPGCYVWLGQGTGAGTCMLHSPNYDFNDAVIPTGVRYWLDLVAQRLAVV